MNARYYFINMQLVKFTSSFMCLFLTLNFFASTCTAFCSGSSTLTKPAKKAPRGKKDLVKPSSSFAVPSINTTGSIQAESAILPMSVDSTTDVCTGLPSTSSCNFSFTPSINFISESDPPSVFNPPQSPQTGKKPVSALAVSEEQQLRNALLQSIVKCMQIQNSLYRLVLLKLQAHVAAAADGQTGDCQSIPTGSAESEGLESREIFQNVDIPVAHQTRGKIGSGDNIPRRPNKEILNDVPKTSRVESACVSVIDATKVSNTVSAAGCLDDTRGSLGVHSKEVNPRIASNAASTEGSRENPRLTPITLLNEVKEPLEALMRCADIQRSLFQGLITVKVKEEGNVTSELCTRRRVNMLDAESKLEAIAFKKKVECGYVRNPFSSQNLKASSSEDVLQHASVNKHLFSQGADGNANLERELPHGRGTLTSPTGELIYTGDWCKGQRHGKGEGLIFSSSADVSYSSAQHGFYIGGWKRNMRHGRGMMLFSSGAVYEGQWKFDKMTGYGALKLPDGTIQEGTWKEGSLDGCTVFTWPDGAAEYREYKASGGDLFSPRPIDKEAGEKLSQKTFIRSQLLNLQESLNEVKDEKHRLTEQLNAKKRKLDEMAGKLHDTVSVIREDYRKQLKYETQKHREEVNKATGEVTELKKELEEMKGALLCQICFERPRDCIILPCSHMLYCRKCVNEHKRKGDGRCPTCRGSINSEILCNINHSS